MLLPFARSRSVANPVNEASGERGVDDESSPFNSLVPDDDGLALVPVVDDCCPDARALVEVAGRVNGNVEAVCAFVPPRPNSDAAGLAGVAVAVPVAVAAAVVSFVRWPAPVDVVGK